jgi:hypothetical protein
VVVNLKSISGLMLAVTVACLSAAPVKAATVTYNLTFSGGESGSLVLDNLSSAPTGTYTGATLTTFLGNSFVSLDAGLFKNQQFNIGSLHSADITKLSFSSTGALTDIGASIKISSPADTLIYQTSGLTYLFENPDGHSLQSGTYSASAPSVSATPLPAALPLYATGLGVLALLRWRRKRKASAGTVGA